MSRIVLLGAGASKEAGVPTTSEMTGLIVKDAAEDQRAQYRNVSWALNFVCGQIIAYDAAAGGRADAWPDIERVASAVRLLAERDALEVTPFISSWHPSVGGIDAGPGRLPHLWAQQFRKAIVESNWDSEVESTFREGVEALAGTESRGIYLQLLRYLTDRLCQRVEITDPNKCNYLEPLLRSNQANGEVIATLNYDTSIEQLATLREIPVDTGIDCWNERGRFSWRDNDQRLLKLHGSIDWYFKPAFPRPSGDHLPVREVSGADSSAHTGNRERAVVFGQREKLRSEGPFLELLVEFAEALADVDELLVVGYSFRDDHVNEQVARWLNRDRGKRLIVIDPHFPSQKRWGEGFRESLLAAFDGSPRLRVLRKPASSGIREVLLPTAD